MQCACAILSPVACPGLQYFSTLSHKRHDFREKFIEHKTRVLIFSTMFVWSILIIRRTERDMIKKIRWCSYKLPNYSWQILMKRELSLQIFEKYPNITLHNHLPCGSWFILCGQTDMAKPTLPFRNCAKSPKMNSQFFFFLAERRILVCWSGQYSRFLYENMDIILTDNALILPAVLRGVNLVITLCGERVGINPG